MYRARDTRLNRDVALKVLPELFSADPDRLPRFKREAQVLASLNHPNIAAIYGFEETNSTRALVLELVDGPTLADRIAQGPMPLDEALPIAKQIAEALEAAHEHGIIHRDLKPANIKVREDGTVKVLDFGLAKAMDSGSGAGNWGPGDPRLAHASQAPTVTSPALMTGAGMILGTAAYMSPEQARGKPVDKRTDIWAFGCVLYEMLVGQRAFGGDDTTETLAAILRAEPQWASLLGRTPPRLQELLQRCVQKNRHERIRDIGDVRFELDAAVKAAPADAAPSPARPLMRRAVAWAASVLIAAAVAGYAAWTARPQPVQLPARLLITLREGEQFTPNGRVGLAISPSGSQIVYTANGRMYLRSLNRLEATPIPGTEVPEGGSFSSTLAARNPFFSPDGRWIGFWQAGVIKKVSVTGGVPESIVAATQPFGASWGVDETIVFSEGPKGIMRVAAAGGAPEVMIPMRDGEIAQGPQLLPGGRAVLLTVRPQGADSWDEARIVVHSLDTGTRTVLIDGGADARYLGTGHLVYARQGTVFAVPLDIEALKVTGNPTPLIEDVATIASAGAVHVAASEGGTLVYVSATSVATLAQRTLVWVDRQGRETPLSVPARTYSTARLSPDEGRVALGILDQENDVWILNVARNTLMRLTFDTARQSTPVWSSDGRRIIFNTELTGLYAQAADGAGRVERLTETRTWQLPLAVSPEGRYLIFREEKPDSNGFASLEASDIMVMTLDGDRQPRPLIQTPFIESNADLSPDGRWIAYQSNESGRFEVYVRPFPNVADGRWQVSAGGGTGPAWTSNGSELVYLTTAGDALMSVAVSAVSSFSAGSPTRLLDARGYFVSAAQRPYDVSVDGQRFLMVKETGPAPGAATVSIVVVQNWSSELQRLVLTN